MEKSVIDNTVKSWDSYVRFLSKKLWSSRAQSRRWCYPSLNSRPSDSSRVLWTANWRFVEHIRNTASWGMVTGRRNSRVGSISSLSARCPCTSLSNGSNRTDSSNLSEKSFCRSWHLWLYSFIWVFIVVEALPRWTSMVTNFCPTVLTRFNSYFIIVTFSQRMPLLRIQNACMSSIIREQGNFDVVSNSVFELDAMVQIARQKFCNYSWSRPRQ